MSLGLELLPIVAEAYSVVEDLSKSPTPSLTQSYPNQELADDVVPSN